MTRSTVRDRLKERSRSTWKILWLKQIINATMSEGDTLLVDFDKKADNVVVNVKKGKKPKADPSVVAKPKKEAKKKNEADDAVK